MRDSKVTSVTDRTVAARSALAAKRGFGKPLPRVAGLVTATRPFSFLRTVPLPSTMEN